MRKLSAIILFILLLTACGRVTEPPITTTETSTSISETSSAETAVAAPTFPLAPLLTGFAINLLFSFIIVRGIYFPREQDKTYVFPFLAFNSIIFFLLGPLLRTELSIGVGFSLFAIFSVMRYRTESMPIREMTYLFVLTALPVINALLAEDRLLVQSIITSGLIVVVLFVFEREWGFGRETSQTIVIDNMKLLKPERRDELLASLRELTGLPVRRVRTGKVNYARKTAEITFYYQPTDGVEDPS